jgi:3',5'-cyclic AMP phosphodiesterase CpdA
MLSPEASGEAIVTAPQPLVFAHLSDPHLSDLAGIGFRSLLSKRILGYLSWRQRRRFEHLTLVLDALRVDLQTGHLDQILITGDLTHLGLPHEFRQVRQWLDFLNHPAVAVVPGNHDSYVPTPWAATYRLWQPYFGRDGDDHSLSHLDDVFPTLTVRGQVAFIGISTARPMAPFIAAGKVGSQQLAKLASLLQDCGEKGLFRVVFLHHPPLPGHEKWRKALWDGDAFLQVIESRGAELVLHGHSHKASCRHMTSAGRQIPVLGVSSASALGAHGHPSLYNRISVAEAHGGWLLDVESREYCDGGKGFAPCGNLSLNIPR